MSEPLSMTLRDLRTAAGWSLGRLARASGVNKSTLSRWESGARAPCIPELESVLGALNATPAQRTALLAALHAPRAARRLAEIAPSTGLPAPPGVGDMLRALRLRSGLTQEQAAAAVGVQRTVITRWERGERTPSVAERHALCRHLGAWESEIVALTIGTEDREPQSVPERWTDRRDAMARRLATINRGDFFGSEDLCYILLERALWRDALERPDARALLARVCAHHGQYLRLEERWRESGPVAERALSLASGPDGAPVAFAHAAILNAVVVSHSGSAEGASAALRRLRQVAVREDLPPAYAAWALSEMALCLVRLRRADLAVNVSRHACDIARKCLNPVELYLRQCDLAERLVDARRPLEALRLAPEPPTDFAPAERVAALLLSARAHHAAGNPNDAQTCLHAIFHLTEDPTLRRWRAKAETLAARF